MDGAAFLTRFGDISAAPKGVTRLRQLVYDLAVVGKFSYRKDDDEPVSTALARLKVAKEGLLRTGRIRRTRVPSEVGPTERPFKIPAHWEWVRLDDLAYPQAGFAFKSNLFNESGRGLPIVRIRDVGKQQTNSFYSGEYRDEFLVSNDDYLISMDGEFRVARWASGRALLNQRVARLIFYNEEIEKSFIALALQKRLAGLQGRKAYTTVDHLSGDQISSALIGLPPLAEQRRIMERVAACEKLCDELDASREDLAEACRSANLATLNTLGASLTDADLSDNWKRFSRFITQLIDESTSVTTLKDSILDLAARGRLVKPHLDTGDTVTHAAVAEKQRLMDTVEIRREAPSPPIHDTEKYLNPPPNWRWIRLGDLCRFIDYRGKTPVKQSHGIRLITAKNVRRGHLSLMPEEFISSADYTSWMVRGFPKAGDVLFTTEAPLGNVAVVELLEEFALAQRVIDLQPFAGIDTHWLMYFFLSPAYQVQIRARASGMTAQGIKAAKLKALPVPVPPNEEQTEVAERIRRYFEQCERLSKSLQERDATQENFASACVRAVLEMSGTSMTNALADSDTVQHTTGNAEKKWKAIPSVMLRLVEPMSEAITASRLAKLIQAHGSSMEAKELWLASGLSIDEFYATLRREIMAKWIAEPQSTQLKTVEMMD
jgi:type I restriction enzyme S subunit